MILVSEGMGLIRDVGLIGRGLIEMGLIGAFTANGLEIGVKRSFLKRCIRALIGLFTIMLSKCFLLFHNFEIKVAHY